MNLYRIRQDVNDNYDYYDSAVVCAKNEAEARWMHPSENAPLSSSELVNWYTDDWTKPENVKVELIGVADKNIKKGVICSSYNT